MDWLIWIGAAISLVGLAGILRTAAQVRRAKREAADDAELRDRIRAILPWNLGALFVSSLGLMCVVVGVTLG